MRRRSVLVGLSVALVMTTACTTGSGEIVSETRDVGDFDRIDVSGGVPVDLTVAPDAVTEVVSTYDDNLQDKIRTEVVDGTLIIEPNGSFTVTGSGRLIEVAVPSLAGLLVSGGANVEGFGATDHLDLEVDGGANVDLSDLVVQTMDIIVSSGAHVTVTTETGIAGEVDGGANLTIQGDPETRDVDVSGGGNVTG